MRVPHGFLKDGQDTSSRVCEFVYLSRDFHWCFGRDQAVLPSNWKEVSAVGEPLSRLLPEVQAW